MTDIKKLKNDTVKGVFWSTTSHLYSYVIQFVITMILSRLLVPNDFATIGLLSIFTLLSNFIIDSGFAQSLIREKELKTRDYSSVFYFNFVVAIILYLVLFFCSPIIAGYFHILELKVISRIIFIQLIFNSLSIVPSVTLTRKMKYNEIAKVSVISITVSAVSGVSAALCGLGVYALVIQMLVLSFMKMILLWIISKWHLTFEFSFSVIKRLFSFSMYLLLTSLIVTVFNNLYTLIIGRRFSQTQLGYYTQAKKMEDIPSQSITTMIASVSYTAMSKVKDDLNLLRIAYKKVLSMNVFIVAPIMMFCLVSADSLIPFLFGEQWLPSIPYFRILCIYGMIFPLFSINGNILKVLGLGKTYTIQEIIRRSLMVLFLIPTIKMGIEAMLWGWVLSMMISIVISFFLCGKPVGYTVFRQFADLFPVFMVIIIPMLFPFVFYRMFELSYFPMLIIQFLLYFGLFILLAKVFKIPAYTDVKNMLSKHPIVNKIIIQINKKNK